VPFSCASRVGNVGATAGSSLRATRSARLHKCRIGVGVSHNLRYPRCNARGCVSAARREMIIDRGAGFAALRGESAQVPVKAAFRRPQVHTLAVLCRSAPQARRAVKLRRRTHRLAVAAPCRHQNGIAKKRQRNEFASLSSPYHSFLVLRTPKCRPGTDWESRELVSPGGGGFPITMRCPGRRRHGASGFQHFGVNLEQRASAGLAP